jgi:hypothetical protein
MKSIIILTLLALLTGTCIGNATLINLDDYILNTGSIYANPDIAFGNRDETTGDYSAMVTFGKDNSAVYVVLSESANNTGLNASNFTTEEGYKAVKKPYPGYLKTNSSTDHVTYVGMVNDHLKLWAAIGSYQRAIDVLKEIAIISREDYQAMKSNELMSSLN